jgi:glucosamine-6-phosphate deaminase
MQTIIANDKSGLAVLAATRASEKINAAITQNGQANIILATGVSQFDTLEQLIKQHIDWSKVSMFHLDEYIGLLDSHPASFRKYLKERFLAKVPALKEVFLVNGEGDPQKECERLVQEIAQRPIDVCLAGFGENAHLAFNDPEADFNTQKAFIIVELDDACRKQQLGEGWFETLADVPDRAISMSIKQIMKSTSIICSVPDERKAIAVRDAVQGPLTAMVPSSILQFHNDCYIYLDQDSASLLRPDG